MNPFRGKKNYKDLRIGAEVNTFLYDFLNTSTIHGFNHLGHTKIHILEKILWLTIVICAVYGAATLSAITLTRYQNNPTVISMERDKFAWNTSFPAATICPLSRYDEEAVKEYIETSNAPNKTLFKDFIVSLAEASYQNFENVVDYTNGISPDEYLDLILKLKMKFSPSEISNSAGNARINYLTEIVSEMGICYCYNSQLAVYNSARFWKTGKRTLFPPNETLYVNPLDGEVFANVMNISSAFDIYIHGPYEVADIATKNTHSEDGYFLQLYLNGITLFSSNKVRALNVRQRKCRYYDESDLSHSPAYSYVLCRMECRIRLSKQLCGCVPHFYRRLDGEKTCSVKGLHCLSKFKEKLILLESACSCLPNCDEVVYYVDDMDTREWFLGSNLQWGLKDYPKMRLKRDVIFGFTELLAIRFAPNFTNVLEFIFYNYSPSFNSIGFILVANKIITRKPLGRLCPLTNLSVVLGSATYPENLKSLALFILKLSWQWPDGPPDRIKFDLEFFIVCIGGMAGLFLGCSVLSFIEIIYFFTLRIFWFFVKPEKQNEKK